MEKNEVTYKIHVERSELDDAIKKAKHLRDILQEAKSLVSDLASMGIGIKSEIEIES